MPPGPAGLMGPPPRRQPHGSMLPPSQEHAQHQTQRPPGEPGARPPPAPALAAAAGAGPAGPPPSSIAAQLRPGPFPRVGGAGARACQLDMPTAWALISTPLHNSWHACSRALRRQPAYIAMRHLDRDKPKRHPWTATGGVLDATGLGRPPQTAAHVLAAPACRSHACSLDPLASCRSCRRRGAWRARLQRLSGSAAPAVTRRAGARKCSQAGSGQAAGTRVDRQGTKQRAARRNFVWRPNLPSASEYWRAHQL